MCQLKNCRYIEYYELDDYGSKVYIHFDDHYNPLWMEYVCKEWGKFRAFLSKKII